MIILHVVILSILFHFATATPVSYQYGSFRRAKAEPPGRGSRSFELENDFWNDGDLQPQTNSLAFEEHRGHITPDFSNGLDYPDPLLLRGQAAKRAVAYLYRKPLFFSEINHIDAILQNQEARRKSGLAGNKLGSLRPHLPFYRFKKEYYNSGYF